MQNDYICRHHNIYGTLRKIIIILFIVFGLGMPHSYGQGCVVCRQTAENMDEQSARGLNGGIVYLAFLPLVLMGTLGFIWWKSYKQN